MLCILRTCNPTTLILAVVAGSNIWLFHDGEIHNTCHLLDKVNSRLATEILGLSAEWLKEEGVV